MPKHKTANAIINQVASELSLPKQTSVFSSSDESFTTLISLTNACGIELLPLTRWQQLIGSDTIVTTSSDDGKYDLPSDFGYMIDQTGWEATNRRPAMGSLTAQEWTYLKGRNFTASTIHVSFRQAESKLWIYPYALGEVATPDGLEISYEYVKRNWVYTNGQSDLPTDEISSDADLILYESHLFERLLKVRFLEAKGFDTTAAVKQLVAAADFWLGNDRSSKPINLAHSYGVPFLGYLNIPDSGYGQ